MRLLLVDDNLDSLNQIKQSIAWHYVVDCADSVEQALFQASLHHYCAILITHPLQDDGCLSLTNQLRTDKIFSPILIVVRQPEKNSEQLPGDLTTTLDPTVTLDPDSHSIIRQPFTKQELHTRLGLLIKHDIFAKNSDSLVKVGEFTLDLCSHSLFFRHQPILLQHKQQLVFESLLTEHPRVVTRDAIASQVWEDEWLNRHNIDTQVSLLRKSLKKLLSFDPVQTVHGFGYRLRV